MRFYTTHKNGLYCLRYQLALLTALLLSVAGSATGMGLDFGTDPTVSFSSATQLVGESSGGAAVTVQLSDTSSVDVTVPFSVTGTATGGGVDYTISASPLIIPAGLLTAEVNVLLTSDTVSEADETVVVTLEPPTNGVLGASNVHTLTITESEVPPVEAAGTAVLPVYQRMDYAVKKFPSPVDVTVDLDGRVYVVDSYAGTVFRLSQAGFPVDGLEGLDTPISAVVDGSGRLYVGSQAQGDVAVYDADFNLLFKLGSGSGEFGHPADIAVDSSGTVYVADTRNNQVSRWDVNGDFIDFLGTPGDGNGQFNRPLSVAIDEIDHNIIVLDRSNGARVQFFDMAGTYQTGWSKYSTAIGGLIRPQQIAVDAMHRLYISESAQNVVLVYDVAGSYLGAVYDSKSPVRSPVGLALSSTNRLYVASRASGKVEVYGLDAYSGMRVSPVALSFTATVGSSNPSPQNVSIDNVGTVSLTVATEVDVDWLSLSGADFVLEPENAGTVEAAVDANGLTPGEYSGTLSLSSGPGMAESVQVMLTVLPEPPYIPAARLSVSPQTISFTCEVGSSPAPQVITISNTGDAPLSWEILPEKDWMSVSSTIGTVVAGAQAQNVVLLPDTASLTAGTYTGYVEVYANGAYDNTAIIDMSLTLTTPTPGPSPTPGPGTSWKGNYNKTWTVAAQTNGTALNGIWGSSNSDIYAVGDSGTILHYDGLDWDEEILPTTLNINGVWGTSVSSVYAVGESGLLVHYDGNKWTDISTLFTGALQSTWCSRSSSCAAAGQASTILANEVQDGAWNIENSVENSGSLRGVWGISDSDLYVVGDFGIILHYSGGIWTSVESSTDENLFAVWGSAADDVYAVGQNGTLLHFDGTAWNPMASGTTNTLRGVWGNGPDEVYAVGDDGTMLLNSGTLWHNLSIGITEDLNDAWAGQQNEIYAVGDDGSIIYGRTLFSWRLFAPVLSLGKKQVQDSQ